MNNSLPLPLLVTAKRGRASTQSVIQWDADREEQVLGPVVMAVFFWVRV
jgi:hypothetical protein